MTMKNFAAAAAESTDEVDVEYTHSFTLGGVDYECRLPTESDVAFFEMSRAAGDAVALREMFNLLRNSMRDETEYEDDDENIPEGWYPDEQFDGLVARCRSRKDRLEISDLVPVAQWLIEERATFPTSSSTGSTSGRQRTGSSSKAASQPARRASTRSRSTSTRAASAT